MFLNREIKLLERLTNRKHSELALEILIEIKTEFEELRREDLKCSILRSGSNWIENRENRQNISPL